MTDKHTEDYDCCDWPRRARKAEAQVKELVDFIYEIEFLCNPHLFDKYSPSFLKPMLDEIEKKEGERHVKK